MHYLGFIAILLAGHKSNPTKSLIKNPQLYARKRNQLSWLYNILITLITLGSASIGLFEPNAANALSSGQVSIQLATDPLLVVDSNYCSSNQGPRAGYVGFTITNTSGITINNLEADINGMTNGFSFAGGQISRQFIGSLAPGASRTVYWYTQYAINCSGGGGFTPTSSTLTVVVKDANSGTVTSSANIETASYISASAGGLVTSTLLGPGYVVGQTIPHDVEYEFGGAVAGDRYNLQPAGNLTYNAGCFQLIGSEVLSSTAIAVPVGIKDQLLFIAGAKQPGSGYRVKIRYFLRYLCAGVSTTASPYASQTSGNTNKKYTGNYEDLAASVVSLPQGTNPFTITKSASRKNGINPGDAITYTINIENTSAFTASIDRITDILPTGVEYVGIAPGSDITTANSGGIPATGAIGTLVWSGQPPNYYTVPAGGSIKLIYTVIALNSFGSHKNTAVATVGNVTIGPASDYIIIGPSADLEVSKIVSKLNPQVDDSITYTVTITNKGTDNVTGVVVKDSLPSQIAYISDDSAGTYDAGTGNWNIGSLNNGETKTLNITVKVNATGTFNNMAQVIASSLPDPDSIPNNSNISEDDQASASVTAIDTSTNPNILLVKRITAVNGLTTTKNGEILTQYIDEATNLYDDNILDNPVPPGKPDTNKWLDADNDGKPDLIGGINGGNVYPGDEIEYTIYFLSSGETTAKKVLICDRISSNTTFITTAFNSLTPKADGGLSGTDRGISWKYNGIIASLTNTQDGDAAQYFSPGTEPATVYPGIDCGGENTNGAIVVNLGDLPNATAPGTPNQSYGFIRFRGRVR